MSTEKETLSVRIVGHNLPGLKFGKDQGAKVERNPVYLGIQRGTRVIHPVPGNAPKAEFNFSIDVVESTKDSLDFRGPFVHGKRGDRFLYLSWGEVDAGGSFSMFRRAALHLSSIKPKDVLRALRSSSVVEGSLNLTDAYGGPICANVSKQIKWLIKHSGKT